jgi:hypothetical protein
MDMAKVGSETMGATAGDLTSTSETRCAGRFLFYCHTGKYCPKPPQCVFQQEDHA